MLNLHFFTKTKLFLPWSLVFTQSDANFYKSDTIRISDIWTSIESGQLWWFDLEYCGVRAQPINVISHSMKSFLYHYPARYEVSANQNRKIFSEKWTKIEGSLFFMFSLLGPCRFGNTFYCAFCMTRRPSRTNAWRFTQGAIIPLSRTPQESL
jgi:hypothetical protein